MVIHQKDLFGQVVKEQHVLEKGATAVTSVREQETSSMTHHRQHEGGVVKFPPSVEM